MTSLYRNWFARAGIDVPKTSRLEISPLFALGPEDISARAGGVVIPAGQDIYIE